MRICLEKKKCNILNILYISYYVLYISCYVLAISYYVLYISYYVLDEYSLVLGLHKMSKKLKSVMIADTLFQGCSSVTSRRVEILRHIDPVLVGKTVCFHKDKVILIFSYQFAI
jgi:hypothetical protein